MQFFRAINSVKAMTFDLDDTLYNNEPIIRQAEAALNTHLKQYHPKAAALTPTHWQQLKRDAITANPTYSSDMGKLRLAVLNAALIHDIPPQDTHTLDAAVQACFDCFYHARSEFDLADDVHKTLSTLSENMTLVGITNGNVNADQIGITPYFDTILHASTSRPMKPSRAMFDEAASFIGDAPENILHVGDNIIKDVYGAINAGFQSAWFACNREMHLPRERASVLPHVALDSFNELAYFL